MPLLPLSQGTTASLAGAAAGALCWVFPVQPTPFVPVTHRTRMPSWERIRGSKAHCKQRLRSSFPIWPWLIPAASTATPALPAGSSPVIPDGGNCPVTSGRAHPWCFAAILCRLWRFGHSWRTAGSLGWGSGIV